MFNLYIFQSESEEEEESESEDEVPIKRGKKGAKGKPQKKAPPPKKKTPQHPPVGEMIIAAIKGLRDNPRKGSSLAAIKGNIYSSIISLYLLHFKNCLKIFIKSRSLKGRRT